MKPRICQCCGGEMKNGQAVNADEGSVEYAHPHMCAGCAAIDWEEETEGVEAELLPPNEELIEHSDSEDNSPGYYHRVA